MNLEIITKCNKKFEPSFIKESVFQDAKNINKQISEKYHKVDADLLKTYVLSTTPQIFPTLKEAKNHSYSKILQALQNTTPKEIAIAIDSKQNGMGRVIFEELNGIESKVSIPKYKTRLLTPRSEVIHGHPSFPKGSLAQPLSFGDFKFLATNNCGKVTALNENAEYCSLSKTSDFIPMTKPEQARMESIFNKEVFGHNLKDNKLDAYDLLGVAQHNFWQKYAPSLGFKYETNFSHLK